MAPEASRAPRSRHTPCAATTATAHGVCLLRWLALALFLLAWNLGLVYYANPLTLLHGHDSVQYQLLVRNRLAGHYEVGDQAHTVRQEGQHPMWRPGLVWVMELFARCLGSVQSGAAAASALGTTLLELAMLWLARRCFGRIACLLVFLILVTPQSVGVLFMLLALGQGPEPWAAAAVLWGLIFLIQAVQQCSWRWAVAAGLTAGLAEWFRTGNLFLFAFPCATYGLMGLCRRRWTDLRLALLAGVAFVGMTFLGHRLVASPVDKNVVNLWHNLVENEGPQLTEEIPGIGAVPCYIGGLKIVPGPMQTYYDFAVGQARTVSLGEFLDQHGSTLASLYRQRLEDVFDGGFWGLRHFVPPVVLACFAVQVVMSLVRVVACGSALNVACGSALNVACGSALNDVHGLALAMGAITFYLGPVVLLMGDFLTHYILMALPLFLLVAARGAVSVGEIAFAWLGRRAGGVSPLMAPDRVRRLGWIVLVLTLAPLGCLTAVYYQGVLATLREKDRQAVEHQAAVDALDLSGKKVACRNMSWFIDRDVQTILLPYASVPELEAYALAHGVDGLLVWEKEKHLLFRATPYGSLAAFDQALRQSAVFAKPQVSGPFRYYPVRYPTRAGGTP